MQSWGVAEFPARRGLYDISPFVFVKPAAVAFAAYTKDVAWSGAGTKTFTAHAIGTASPDRYVVVFISAQNATNITSVTVAGTNCTRVLVDSTNWLYITDSPITTGTTGDIAVTISGASTANVEIGVWAVTGLVSNSASTTATSSTNGGALNITVPANGVAIACANSAAGADSGTWSVATERFDDNVESGYNVSGGDFASMAGGSFSPAFTWGGASSVFFSMAVALR